MARYKTLWLLFFLIRDAPRSTFFPYTTLFRSRAVPQRPGVRREVARGSRSRRATREDRKSTRLNSSHSQISYAVFCLKKKSISASQSFSVVCVGGLHITQGREPSSTSNAIFSY